MAIAATDPHDLAANAVHATTQINVATNAGPASAISWSAVFAGAIIAAAASLALLSLGTGLGLSAISPWAQRGVQASTFGVSSIVWVIVTQLCASALGGYLAGRLGARWAEVHADEVYFRGTANGLLAWAVATLVTAGILLSAASSAVGLAARSSATLASGAVVAGAAAASNSNSKDGSMAYLVDSLFRRDGAKPVSASDAGSDDSARAPVAEASRIYAMWAGVGELPPQDAHYLGQLVAQRTGLSPADAELRVTQTYASLQTNINNAKTAAAQAADKARKAGIQASLWLFIALLSGAFAASYAAMVGGREQVIAI